MRIVSLFILVTIFSFPVLQSQDFYDDFESYEVGDYLAESSQKWETWDNDPGSQQDVQITDRQAFSGTKSIYFEQTDPGIFGGPDDIVLPFGGVKTSGVFELKMMMYIPDGSQAYFNFQGGENVGEEYPFQTDFYFNGIGEVDPENSSSMDLYYPEDEWFEVRVHIDMDNDFVSFYINGECVGTLMKLDIDVSYLDLYATHHDEYYVDDVEYTYFTDSPDYEKDAGIRDFEWIGAKPDYAGGSSQVIIAVQNNVGPTIHEAVVKTIYQGEEARDTLTNLNLEVGENKFDTLDRVFTIQEGFTKIKGMLVSVNGESMDQYACNDIRHLAFNPYEIADHKSVLIEAGTSTSCGDCPEEIVYMRLWKSLYPDLIVPVSVHTQDPMLLNDYFDAIDSTGHFGELPNMFIDRRYSYPPEYVEFLILNRAEEEPSAVLSNGAVVDEENRTIKISVTANFLKNVSGEYSLSAVITEDSVSSSIPFYRQDNNYSGSLSWMAEFNDLPDPVPADQMVYNHVARVKLGGFSGDPDSLPSQISVGEQKTVHFSWTVPDEYDMDQLNIVSILHDGEYVDNATIVSLNEAVDNGYVDVKRVRQEEAVRLFPNPAHSKTFVELSLNQAEEVKMEIIQSNGRVVKEQSVHVLPGNHTISINLKEMHAGMYYVRLRTDEGQWVKKLVVTSP